MSTNICDMLCENKFGGQKRKEKENVFIHLSHSEYGCINIST
jgi:hypothetical protein